MSALDKNKIFFGLIHYVLSEQNNVDWILKTSLVNFTGINSTVDNKKYKQNSVTDDIIEYIYQVKPYHVTFEQFIEKYSSKQDEVNVTTQEQNNITMYIRYDAITSEFEEQGNMNDYEYMDTHMANRLWYFKHNDLKAVYGNDEAIKDYIKDVMDCHFKGITVEGGGFDIDKSGYDAFLYDSTLYDAPTLTSDYCLVDYKENLQYPYTKSFIKIGLKSFKLESEDEIYPGNITIYSDYNGQTTQVENFNLKNNIVTLFYAIRKYEKLTIVNTVNNIRKGYVFVGHPFIESEDETNIRRFVDIGTTEFEIPDGNLGSKKVTVHIEYPNGSRIPTTNFEKIDKNVVIYDTLKENYHVILTVIDYKQIYDKIYTWEDCYGQSNNVIALDGDKFLRPYYEKERPSELCVSYPIHNLMIYTENKSGKINSVYNADYKDWQYKLPITQTYVTKLSQDLNIGDKIIKIDNISKVIKPKIGENNQVIPGKIIIGSEIIEFYEYEIGENNQGILKSIRRAVMGSYLAEKHYKGDNVYTYNEQSLVDCSTKSISITTLVKDDTENKFIIPGTFKDNKKIEIYKKPYINLLSDITYLGKYFDISSDNVNLPGKVELQSELYYNTVHKNQSFIIELAETPYEITVDDDCFSIKELTDKITSVIAKTLGFYVYDIDGKLKFSASEGKSIKVYNKNGTPLQEMFGNSLMGNKSKFNIWLDGYNGISINGNDILWGNDVNSVQWMKDNPRQGTIDDAISTINNMSNVNKLVKAYNRDGYIEIVSLVNEEIRIENVTNLSTPIDNLSEIGIEPIIFTQPLFKNDTQLNYYQDNPDKLGNIFINNEKLYFKNIQRIISGRNEYYRISNYFTDKEYKTNEAKIMSIKPILVDKNDYIINGDNDYITFKTMPSIGEIITIYNEK